MVRFCQDRSSTRRPKLLHITQKFRLYYVEAGARIRKSGGPGPYGERYWFAPCHQGTWKSAYRRNQNLCIPPVRHTCWDRARSSTNSWFCWKIPQVHQFSQPGDFQPAHMQCGNLFSWNFKFLWRRPVNLQKFHSSTKMEPPGSKAFSWYNIQTFPSCCSYSKKRPSVLYLKSCSFSTTLMTHLIELKRDQPSLFKNGSEAD